MIRLELGRIPIGESLGYGQILIKSLGSISKGIIRWEDESSLDNDQLMRTYI